MSLVGILSKDTTGEGIAPMLNSENRNLHASAVHGERMPPPRVKLLQVFRCKDRCPD